MEIENNVKLTSTDVLAPTQGQLRSNLGNLEATVKENSIKLSYYTGDNSFSKAPDKAYLTEAKREWYSKLLLKLDALIELKDWNKVIQYRNKVESKINQG